jgi:hypothetical protein
MYHLGLLYYHGQGVPQDYAKAAELWTAASYANSWYMLGILYCDGKGVPKDREKAIALFKKAADNGAYDYGDGKLQIEDICFVDIKVAEDAVAVLKDMGIDYIPAYKKYVSKPAAATSTGDGEPNRWLQVGSFILGSLVTGWVAAFIAGLAFGKHTIPTELIRIAASITGGILCFKAMSPAGKTLQETGSRRWLIILIVVGSVFFMWRSDLPYPGIMLDKLKNITDTSAPAANAPATTVEYAGKSIG